MNSPFRFDIITLIPNSFEPLRNLGVIGRAFDAGLVEDQGQLDRLDKKEIDCQCPKCGHEFTKQI